MTDLLIPTRRKFITGLVSLLAAPLVVRAESIMPVRAIEVPHIEVYEWKCVMGSIIIHGVDELDRPISEVVSYTPDNSNITMARFKHIIRLEQIFA